MLEYKCEREGTHFAEVDPGTRRKRARLAASRRTSRCGFVNTRVPRVGLRRTGTRTQRGTFFLAVLKYRSGSLRINALWRLRSLRTPPGLQSASSKQEAPSPEVKDFGLAVRTRRVLTTPQGANGVSRERVGWGSSPEAAEELVIVIRRYRRNSRLFDSTDTLEKAIAPAARTG